MSRLDQPTAYDYRIAAAVDAIQPDAFDDGEDTNEFREWLRRCGESSDD